MQAISLDGQEMKENPTVLPGIDSSTCFCHENANIYDHLCTVHHTISSNHISCIEKILPIQPLLLGAPPLSRVMSRVCRT